MNPHDENLLIQKAQNGDREVLGVLWDALTPKLFGYLMNITRNRTLAEDLLQSTWLKAIDALPHFVPRGISVSAWFFAIARNEFLQYLRKSKKEVPFDPEIHDEPNDDHKNINDKILVEQALKLLSYDDREILRLRYIADLELKDIARILNLNFVTVRVRIHRAISRARAAIISKL